MYILLPSFILMLILYAVPANAAYKIIATDWVSAVMGLMGGVTFLLYGLNKMTSSFKAIAGHKLKDFLSEITKTRIKSLLTGITVTAIVQSSAATTVMVVGFISARVMSLPQSLGVILGADIGTTITVQLIAFRVSQYALYAIVLGFIIKAISKTDRTWHIGRAIMAIGLIFFGIFIIGESMSILKTMPVVANTIEHLTSPLLGIIVGIGMTALMQSSAASIAVVMAFATQGVISLEGSIYLVLGANIGTCVTAAIASIGKNSDAKRAATAHAFFKISTVLIILPFIPWVIEIAEQYFRPTGEAPMPREIANMHTTFNIIVALIFLPLTNIIAKMLTRLIPEKTQEELIKARYIDKFLLETPTLALNAARNEIARMGKRISDMMEEIPEKLFSGSPTELAEIKQLEREVDALYRQIIIYLGHLTKESLTEEQIREHMWLINVVNHLENIGDLIGDDLYKLGKMRTKKDITVSKQTEKMLRKLFTDVMDILNASLSSVYSMDAKKAEKIIPRKKNFNNQIQMAVHHQAKLLASNESNKINTYSLEMDVIDKLQRIYYHCRKIARETLYFQEATEKKGSEPANI